MKKFENPLPTTLEFQSSHPLQPKTLSQKLFKKLDLEGPSLTCGIKTFKQTPMPSSPSLCKQFYY
jgi:hypothetical protein